MEGIDALDDRLLNFKGVSFILYLTAWEEYFLQSFCNNAKRCF